MLSPAALSIITSSFHGPARAKALAAWGAVGGAGAALGVLLGGVLTQVVDWRLIFFINLPVAVALAIGARKIVPAETEKPRWRGLDLRGAALATGSMAAIVYAITQAEKAGWISAQTLGIGGVGILGLAAFAVCELRTAQPLLRIEQLRDRAVGGGLLLCLVNAGLMFGLFLLCSLYLQLALGHGPLPTGLAFIPLAVAAGIGAHAAGHLLNRYGLRWSAGPALALAAGGLLWLSHVPAHGSYLRDMLPGMLMAGFGLGLSGTAMAVGVLTGARSEEAGMVSGASATTHEIGGTLGIAIYASIATAASGGIFVGPACSRRHRARVRDRRLRRPRRQRRGRIPAPRSKDVPAEAAARASDAHALTKAQVMRAATRQTPPAPTPSHHHANQHALTRSKGDPEMTAAEITLPVPAQPGRAKRIAAIATAVTALVLALGGTAALAANALRDGDGYFTWPTETFTSNGYAIAMKTVDISHAPKWVFSNALLDSVRVKATSNRSLFIGIAPAGDVQRYLNRTEHDDVSELTYNPFQVNYDHSDGGAPQAAPGKDHSGSSQPAAPEPSRSAGSPDRVRGALSS